MTNIRVDEFKAYSFNNEFICSMVVTSLQTNSVFPETIVILDRSGSMRDSVRKITSEVLPIFFDKLSYEPERVIHLIAFDDNCETYKYKTRDLKVWPLYSGGGTLMTPAVKALAHLLSNFDKSKSVRILTISDGIVDDPQAIIKAGAYLCSELQTHRYKTQINSQAVRLFTSAKQPDTTALCSLLQLNNTTKSKLLDVSADLPSEYIATQMATLFLNDGLDEKLELRAESRSFKRFPWDQHSSDTLLLKSGQNVFWMDRQIPQKMSVEETLVKVLIKRHADQTDFYKLMDKKIDFVVDRIRILKVLGTQEAKVLSNRIFKYFNEVESSFGVISIPNDNEAQLVNRVKEMVRQVAKDEDVNKLDEAQKASYLQQSSPSTELSTPVKRGSIYNFGELQNYNELFGRQSNSNEYKFCLSSRNKTSKNEISTFRLK